LPTHDSVGEGEVDLDLSKISPARRLCGVVWLARIGSRDLRVVDSGGNLRASVLQLFVVFEKRSATPLARLRPTGGSRRGSTDCGAARRCPTEVLVVHRRRLHLKCAPRLRRVALLGEGSWKHSSSNLPSAGAHSHEPKSDLRPRSCVYQRPTNGQMRFPVYRA
jgi:hypothetical protein